MILVIVAIGLIMFLLPQLLDNRSKKVDLEKIKEGEIEAEEINTKFKEFCTKVNAYTKNNLLNPVESKNEQVNIESIKNEILAQKEELFNIIQKCSAFLEKKQDEYIIFDLSKYNIFINYYGDMLNKLEAEVKQANSIEELIKPHSEFAKITTLLFTYENLFIKKDFDAINNIKEYNKVIDEYQKKYIKENDDELDGEFDDDDNKSEPDDLLKSIIIVDLLNHGNDKK